MSELDLSIENILSELSKKLDGDQIFIILNSPTEFPTELINKISIATAQKYWDKQIDYLSGDYIMNNLYAFWMTNDQYCMNHAFPDTAWKCFDAFDSGEYPRENDDRGIDPSEKYTRPLIGILLRELGFIT